MLHGEKSMAAIGLINLSLLDGRKRSKEVGIGKIIGATPGSIIGLLLLNFLRIGFIANLIALPAAYFIVNKWLTGYQTKIDFQWWTLPSAFILSIVIVVLSTFYSSVSATMVNPSKLLKSE